MRSEKFEIDGVFSGDNLPDQEGPVLEFNRDQRNLVLKLNGVSEQEIRAFQAAGSLKLALFAQKDVVFLLVHVSGVIDWSDAPYSVVTFSQEIWPPGELAGAKFTAVLVEGSDRRIKALREFELESSFAGKFLAEVEAQKQKPITVEEFLKRIPSIQKKFAPTKMLKEATAIMTA